jgi:flagellar basal body-associated protein FliL
MDSSTTDLGGVLWLIIDVVAVAALGAAIAYSAWMWRHRRKTASQRRLTEEAVREIYQRDDD